MINGIYTSATGMLAQEVRQNLVANDLANVNTVGFKRDIAVFKAINQRGHKEKIYEDVYGEQVQLDGIYTRFVQGSLKFTNNNFDVAIAGDGFFNVQTDSGIGYTRNGAFTTNELGQLATQEGYLVLNDQDQPIQITGDELVIGEDGTILQGTEDNGKLKITDFMVMDAMHKKGYNVYVPDEDAGPFPAEKFQVKQGMLEQSTTSTVKEMVIMISALRAYEANQKAILAQDETLGKSVNQVGSLRA